MDIFEFLDSEKIMKIAEIGGPLIGILLPVIESFFPILPLVLFVTINVSVFGFFWGYLFSWIGNCLGSWLLFLAIRKIGGKKIEAKVKESKYREHLEKIKSKNFSVLFMLYCFPFTPSFLMSGTAALANMSTKEFLAALLPAKFIMMISLSVIGVNVRNFFEDPMKSILFVLVILLINFALKCLVEKTSFLKGKNSKDNKVDSKINDKTYESVESVQEDKVNKIEKVEKIEKTDKIDKIIEKKDKIIEKTDKITDKVKKIKNESKNKDNREIVI